MYVKVTRWVHAEERANVADPRAALHGIAFGTADPGSSSGRCSSRGRFQSGSADVIAIGKAALAQHDWLRRARDGRDTAGDPHPEALAPLADIKHWELTL